MKLTWRLNKHGQELEVMLSYNMYIGSKVLHINGKEILSVKRPSINKAINFQYNNKEYKLELASEGFGYTGKLITPEGEVISPERVKVKRDAVPVWIIPFVVMDMVIPVISVESLTPWLIAVLSSFATAKVAQNSKINLYKKLSISMLITVCAWAAYFMFYLIIRNSGIHGGFLPTSK
jgi:hypothetical protein